MIVSNRANRSKSRILQAFVMVLGLVLLPLGIASAQDYEAVSKRLKESVKKGEITGKQADAMMGALKKSASSNQQAVSKRLKAAVKAGELTAKQAAAMMGTLKKGSHSNKKTKKHNDKRSDKKSDKGPKERYAAIEKEVYAAVRAGKVSREEAARKLAALKKQMFGGQDKKDHDRKRGKTDWDGLKKEVEGAVKSGELTREEADGIYKIEKGVEDGEMTRKQADMIYRIEGAVKEGKMTRRQADERYRGMFGEKDDGQDKKDGDHDRKKVRDLREKYAAIEKEIIAAVRAGKITREEAVRELAALKKEMFGGRDRKEGDHDNNQEEGKRRRYYAAEQKIKKAVDEGKISAEDARKRLEGLRRALWPDKREESRKKDEPTREEYIERVEKRIKIAVEEGKITEEQGAQRMKGFLKQLEEKEREE